MSQQEQSSTRPPVNRNSSNSSGSSCSTNSTNSTSSSSSSSRNGSNSQSSTLTLVDASTATSPSSSPDITVELRTLRFIEAYRQLKMVQLSAPVFVDMCEYVHTCSCDDLLTWFERERDWPPMMHDWTSDEEREAARRCVELWTEWLDCATSTQVMRGMLPSQPSNEYAFDRLWQASSQSAGRELLFVSSQSSASSSPPPPAPLLPLLSRSAQSSQSTSVGVGEEEACITSADRAAAFRECDSMRERIALASLWMHDSADWSTSTSTPFSSQPPAPSVSWSQQPWISSQQSELSTQLPTLSWSRDDVFETAIGSQCSDRTGVPSTADTQYYSDEGDESIVGLGSTSRDRPSQ